MNTPTHTRVQKHSGTEQSTAESPVGFSRFKRCETPPSKLRMLSALAVISAAAATPLNAQPTGGVALPVFRENQPSSGQRTPPMSKPASNAYRLCGNDLVQIRVFQEDELDTSVRIAKDGSITFPMIGSVCIGGKTLPEACLALETALRTFCKSPQVVIRIVEYNKRRFTVLGQVNRPGTFEMPDEGPLSLLEAIGMAGGYSRIANPSKVTLKRTSSDGSEQIFRLDAKRMARESSIAPFHLKTGDTIVVEETLF
jgi:protein involved in polysaccharide export with SLBB domain